MKKNRTPESWLQLQQKLSTGDVVTGTVFQVEPYGSYVDIGEDFYGIALAPDIREEPGIDIHEYPQIGETVSARILNFSGDLKDINFNYLHLSIKDL